MSISAGVPGAWMGGGGQPDPGSSWGDRRTAARLRRETEKSHSIHHLTCSLISPQNVSDDYFFFLLLLLNLETKVLSLFNSFVQLAQAAASMGSAHHPLQEDTEARTSQVGGGSLWGLSSLRPGDEEPKRWRLKAQGGGFPQAAFAAFLCSLMHKRTV